MSWSHPINEDGRPIPPAGRSAGALSGLPATAPGTASPRAPAARFLLTVALALFGAVAIGETATSTFTAVNAARLEAR